MPANQLLLVAAAVMAATVLARPAAASAQALPPLPSSTARADTTYDVRDVDVAPKPANESAVRADIRSNYPSLLRDAGVTGDARVRMRVNGDGTVDRRSITVLRASQDAFETPAARVAARMRFSPAMKGGVAVPVWIETPIHFAI